MEFLEFQCRITTIMKIQILHASITKIIFFLKIPLHNIENHKKPSIPYTNNELFQFYRIDDGKSIGHRNYPRALNNLQLASK